MSAHAVATLAAGWFIIKQNAVAAQGELAMADLPAIARIAHLRHDENPFFYVMPNAMRKVLEIFLAFKLPGADGLSSKVDNIARGPYGLDAASVRALDRLVQLESLADNLDDLISFSSLTIEETKSAADALNVMMKAVDKEHYERLCSLCR